MEPSDFLPAFLPKCWKKSWFLALDFYFKTHGLSWESKPKFGALWGREGDTLFIKPQEFYNESGRAVAEFMRFYKINSSNVLVICDNFDLEFGKVRARVSGAAGGNNGLKSIDKYLNSTDYPRLRIGTEDAELRKKMGDVDFVLSKFTLEEKTKLPEILQAVNKHIEEFV